MIKDYTIARNHCEAPDHVAVLDEEGTAIWLFPSDWRDDQVATAMEFAREAFEKGEQSGRLVKASEIRKVLFGD